MGQENVKKKNQGHFSVSVELIETHRPLSYDLYVNSSTHLLRDRFVKIYPRGRILPQEDLLEFKKKYLQIYILESQRKDYLKSLAMAENLSAKEKVSILKDSAIEHLNQIFDQKTDFSTEVMAEAMQGCRDTVASMVLTVKNQDILSLQELIGNLSFHDFYTYDHSINVSMYTILIYRLIYPEASEDDLVVAGLSGLLHDIGKVKISTAIINNPDKLTPEEFAQIKEHPENGYELLQTQELHLHEVNWDLVGRVVLEHHENVNGTGYPKGLTGQDIHLLAKIVAIADFFDAITTKRSYHDALSVDEALSVMSRSVGKKIDADLFLVFEKNVSRIVHKRMPRFELPDNFDPCQPNRQLPLNMAKPEILESHTKEHVVITTEEEELKKKAS